MYVAKSLHSLPLNDVRGTMDNTLHHTYMMYLLAFWKVTVEHETFSPRPPSPEIPKTKVLGSCAI